MAGHEHTLTDGLGDAPTLAIDVPGNAGAAADAAWRARPRNERMASDKIECNACPVLCQISAGKAGACDRYANQGGALVRVDRVPAIFGARDYVVAGGLMSYNSSHAWHARAAAGFVDKILRGAKPGELPVQQPTQFELVINQKTAEALGLTIPQLLLLRADEVIE